MLQLRSLYIRKAMDLTSTGIKPFLHFALDCMSIQSDTNVQEDKAPSHAHSMSQLVYDMHEVSYLRLAGSE
jgi:hypothetical protein